MGTLTFLAQKMKEILWDAYSMSQNFLVDNEKEFPSLKKEQKLSQDELIDSRASPTVYPVKVFFISTMNAIKI